MSDKQASVMFVFRNGNVSEDYFEHVAEACKAFDGIRNVLDQLPEQRDVANVFLYYREQLVQEWVSKDVKSV
jgi:hypothetical protein